MSAKPPVGRRFNGSRPLFFLVDAEASTAAAVSILGDANAVLLHW